MIRVVGDDPAQLIEHPCCDALRAVEAVATVYYSMPDDSDVRQPDVTSEALHQMADSRCLIRGFDLAVLLLTALIIGDDQPRTRHTDPLDPT